VGKGLTYLGFAAFYGCQNLERVFFRGNAPTLGQDGFGHSGPFFGGDPLATVYYLPGTTGWGPTFDGRPTALWNPQVQNFSLSLGQGQGRFGLTIAGTVDIPVVIEASSDLLATAWTPLQTCTLTNGLIDFIDPSSTSYPVRFYRIRAP
jgi:hypothetical protein